MDEETIKAQNPKCRLYWCLIEFIGWRYKSVMLLFSIPLNCCPSTFSLTSPTPPPLPKVNVHYIQTMCGCGSGRCWVKTTFTDWCHYSFFVHDQQNLYCLGKAPPPLFFKWLRTARPSDVLGVDFRLPPVERRPQGPAPSRAEPRLLARLAAAGIRTSVEDDSRIFHGHGHALGRVKE